MEDKIREESAPVILLICMIFIGLITVVYRYRIPVTYDPEVMKVEIYKAAPITENGYTQWRDLDNLDFRQTKKIIEDDSKVISKIRLALTEEIECAVPRFSPYPENDRGGRSVLSGRGLTYLEWEELAGNRILEK